MEPDSHRRLFHAWKGKRGKWWLQSATSPLDATKSYKLQTMATGLTITLDFTENNGNLERKDKTWLIFCGKQEEVVILESNHCIKEVVKTLQARNTCT